MGFVNKFFEELKNEFILAPASQKLNIISNIFTILGVSIVFFLTNIILEKIVKQDIFLGGFFLFFAFFSIAFGLFILLTFLASTIYKEFSSGRWFGFIIYLSIIIFIWCSFFGILFSIGIETFNLMVFDLHFRGKL